MLFIVVDCGKTQEVKVCLGSRAAAGQRLAGRENFRVTGHLIAIMRNQGKGSFLLLITAEKSCLILIIWVV